MIDRSPDWVLVFSLIALPFAYIWLVHWFNKQENDDDDE